MLAVGTPKMGPMSVGIGLPRSSVRNTSTLTRFDCPDGPTGKVTSVLRTDGDSPIMRLAFAALTALWTAGPVEVRLLKSLNASATAPESAPASAAFCAWDLAVIIMPTSTASVVAAMNAMNPSPTITNVMPRWLCRSRRMRLRMAPPGNVCVSSPTGIGLCCRYCSFRMVALAVRVIGAPTIEPLTTS